MAVYWSFFMVVLLIFVAPTQPLFHPQPGQIQLGPQLID